MPTTPLSFLRISLLITCCAHVSIATAQSDTWSGGVSGNWTDSGNWISGNIPGVGDTATFNSNGSGNTTIDLNGDVTLHQITFTSPNVTSYTFGGGNIIFDESGNVNDVNLNIDANVAANTTLTFNGDFFLGTNATTNDINFNPDSTAANVSLVINGNIDTKSGGTAGVKRLEFGDFSDTPDDGVAIINGDILNNGGATRIETYIAGANVTLAGQAIGAQHRTIIRDGGTLNITGTGRAGQNVMDIRSGTVNITSDNQIWQNQLWFGDRSQANAGDATLTIGDGNTATLSTNLYYEAHGGHGGHPDGMGSANATSTIANRGFLLGGTLHIDQSITNLVEDNTLVDGPELTISSNITSNDGNRTWTKRSAGTVLLSGNTLSFGHLTVDDGKVMLLTDDAFNNQLRNFSIQSQDGTQTNVLTAPVIDLNGAIATVNALNLGNAATFLSGSKATPDVGFVSTLDDSVGDGRLRLDNNINVRNGTTDVIQFEDFTLNFQGGQYILGGNSGALALIDRHYNNAGGTGNVSIHMVSGTFEAGELLTQVDNNLNPSGGGRTATALGSNMTTAALGLGDIRNDQAIINADLEIVDNGANQGGISFIVEDNRADIDLVVNGDISDDATPGDNTKLFRDLTLQDGGVVQLNGNNTHDRTFISNRKLIAGSGDIFGTGNGTRDNGDGDGRVWLQQNNTGTRWIWDGAPTLDVNGQDLIFKENFIIGGSTTNNVSVLGNIRVEDSVGGGRLILAGNNANQRNDFAYQGGTGYNYVARTAGNQRTAIIDTDIQINHHSSFTIQKGADDIDLIINGNIYDSSGGTFNINKGHFGTLELTGSTGTYNQLLILDGKVIIHNFGILGDNVTRLGGASSTNPATVQDLDGTLEFRGTTDQTWGLGFQIGEYTNSANSVVGDTGSGILLNNGTGVLTFTDEYFTTQSANTVANRTLTLGGNNTGRNTILGSIRDVSTNAAAPTFGLIKTGSGTWIAKGNNTYTGNTDVQAGRLDVNGNLVGSLNVAANASIGGDATFGGNVTFGGNNTLVVDATTTAALGTTADSNHGGAGNISVVLEGKGGDASGNIIVYEYTGALGAGTNSLDFSDFNNTATGDTTLSGRGGGSANLINDAANNRIVVNLGYATRTWNGNSGNTTWNEGAASDANWVEGDRLFYNGDTVIFENSNSAPGGNVTGRTVNVSGTVAPNKIDIQGDDFNFTFNGGTIQIEEELLLSGNGDAFINSVISGNGRVVKGHGDDGMRDQSDGLLRLSGNNTYSGGTLLQERTLQVNHNNALGTGLVTISDDNQGSGNSGENQDPVLQLIGGADQIANDIYITNGGGAKSIQVGSNGHKILTGTLTTDELGKYETRLDANTVARSMDYQGKITGVGGIHAVGLGEVTLSNASNDFKGGITSYRGNLNVASIGNVGEASHAGAGDIIQLGMRSLTGTLTYTGTGNSTNRRVQVGDYWFNDGAGYGGGGRIRNNGTGALNFTNSTFNQQDSDSFARLDARTLTLGGSYDGSAGSNRIDGVIANNVATDGTAFVDPEEVVSLDIDGSSWEFNGANTYSGNTAVSGNSTALFINGNSSAATGDVTIGTGSDTPTFGGTGTVGGNTIINAGAIHTAGTTTTSGQQTFSNNLTYDKGATVSWNLISNSTSSSEFDQFAVGGSIGFTNNTGTGDLILNINFGGDFDDTFWQNGANTNEWEIWDGTIASLAGIDFTIQLSGDSTGANLQYFDSNAFEIANDNFGMTDTGTGIWLQQIAPIPEPSTYALMSLALAAFGWVTRQRRG